MKPTYDAKLIAASLHHDDLAANMAVRLTQLDDFYARTKQARKALGIAKRALATGDIAAVPSARLAVEVAMRCLDGRRKPRAKGKR